MAEREPKRKSYYMYVRLNASTKVSTSGVSVPQAVARFGSTIDRKYQILKIVSFWLCSCSRSTETFFPPPPGCYTTKYSAHVSLSLSLVVYRNWVISYYEWRRHINERTTSLRDSRLTHVHAPHISLSNKINSFANNQYLLWGWYWESITIINHHHHHHRRRRYYY